MGIRDLWKVVRPTVKEVPLLALSVEQGYLRHLDRTYIVGVDTSAWLDSTQAAFQKATVHTHCGENPELRAIFFKLCHFLQAPITLVFVIDGPLRPQIKRGHKVKTTPPWILNHLTTLIQAFGFYIHQAPGEAEAELARMNELGHIDAVLTDDSDTFVFGARTVIRNSTVKGMTIASCVYTCGQTNGDGQVIGMSRGGLLMYAVLVGGDYGPGLPNCGTETAKMLADHGYGDSLLEILKRHNSPPDTLTSSLDAWRTVLATELRHNYQHRFPHRYTELADTILSDKFDLLNQVRAYWWPTTSWSLNNAKYPIPLPRMWRPKEPLIELIADFGIATLGWKDTQILATKLHKNVWPGVVLRKASSALRIYREGKVATPYGNFTILKEHRVQPLSLAPSMPLRRIFVTTANFAQTTQVNGIAQHLPNDISVSIPSAILDTSIIPSFLTSKRAGTSHSHSQPQTRPDGPSQDIIIIPSDDEGGGSVISISSDDESSKSVIVISSDDESDEQDGRGPGCVQDLGVIELSDSE